MSLLAPMPLWQAAAPVNVACVLNKPCILQTHTCLQPQWNETRHQGQMLAGKNKQLFLIVKESLRNVLPRSSIMELYQQHKSSLFT